MIWDVAIAGGGPAGLAVAVAAGRAGLRALVLERRGGPPDKACGEGLLPPALEALADLGVLERLPAAECARFEAVRWIDPDGTSVEARLPAPGGLGVRRLALVGALAGRARQVGATLRDGCDVLGFQVTASHVLVTTGAEVVQARVLVAADGLASPLRCAAGLDRPARGPRRFAMRRHFLRRPWARRVEVHFGPGIEAYVTPAGADRVGVALLWEHGTAERPSFDGLLERFPVLQAQLHGAEPETRVLGAGPLRRGARARVADRFLLVGDAAGYIDALTGEGLSLALGCARDLGGLLPAAIAAGATARALAPYEAVFARRYRRYALVTEAMLAAARRPLLRRQLVRALARRPGWAEACVRWAVAAR